MAPHYRTYPEDKAGDTHDDVVVEAFFSEPVKNLDRKAFTLADAKGNLVPSFVEQIGDGAWGLFPHQVFLSPGMTYTARIASPVCDFNANCIEFVP